MGNRLAVVAVTKLLVARAKRFFLQQNSCSGLLILRKRDVMSKQTVFVLFALAIIIAGVLAYTQTKLLL